MFNSNTIKALIAIVLVITVDQITKHSILSYFSEHSPDAIEILPYMNIVLLWNKGISFGIFNHSQQSQLIMVLVTVLIVAVLSLWLLKCNDAGLILAISLVIGGAIGNILDRMLHGGVIDFLDFHIASYHFPAFNVADLCISIGVMFLILAPARSKGGSSEQTRRS